MPQRIRRGGRSSTLLALGRTGKLEVQINSMLLADGTRVLLRAVNAGARWQPHRHCHDYGGCGQHRVFPAAPLALLIKGKDLTIPKGTFVTAYINGDLPLDAENFKASSIKNTAAVNFKADTEGAEIWIEDKFVGNVPATIRLPEGEYQVVGQKPGFQTWKRMVAVTAGSLMNLTISLEKLP